jgi:hypothetical protein
MNAFRFGKKEKCMRPGTRSLLGATLVLLLILPAALVAADEYTANLVPVILESFDQPDKSLWIVQGSKFATKDYPQSTLVRAWPDALFGANKEKKDLFALGIHGKFDRKAYNSLEIIPAKKDESGKLVPNPLPIPGRIKALDLWVWGSNYNFYMDLHLRDYQGVDHVIPLGDLSYQGWRNLSVTIPPSIPQERRHIPRYQGLEITEFVIWTRPTESVDDFYVFVDQIKVLTDMFESPFDGDNLADQDYLKEVWSAGAQAGK